jgi:hypothetical protein
MGEYFLYCPECGSALSSELYEDGEQRISINFFCEGAGEDRFSFRIKTGLTVFDIEELEKGKPLKKVMNVELLERKSDPSKE